MTTGMHAGDEEVVDRRANGGAEAERKPDHRLTLGQIDETCVGCNLRLAQQGDVPASMT